MPTTLGTTPLKVPRGRLPARLPGPRLRAGHTHARGARGWKAHRELGCGHVPSPALQPYLADPGFRLCWAPRVSGMRDGTGPLRQS